MANATTYNKALEKIAMRDLMMPTIIEAVFLSREELLKRIDEANKLLL